MDVLLGSLMEKFSAPLQDELKTDISQPNSLRQVKLFTRTRQSRIISSRKRKSLDGVNGSMPLEIRIQKLSLSDIDVLRTNLTPSVSMAIGTLNPVK